MGTPGTAGVRRNATSRRRSGPGPRCGDEGCEAGTLVDEDRLSGGRCRCRGQVSFRSPGPGVRRGGEGREAAVGALELHLEDAGLHPRSAHAQGRRPPDDLSINSDKPRTGGDTVSTDHPDRACRRPRESACRATAGLGGAPRGAPPGTPYATGLVRRIGKPSLAESAKVDEDDTAGDSNEARSNRSPRGRPRYPFALSVAFEATRFRNFQGRHRSQWPTPDEGCSRTSFGLGRAARCHNPPKDTTERRHAEIMLNPAFGPAGPGSPNVHPSRCGLT